MRRWIIFLLVVVVFGVYWVRRDPPPQRLFSYKDSHGKVVFTNVLEDVPEEQRAKALARTDLPGINTADYDDYILQTTGQSMTWFGRLFSPKKKKDVRTKGSE